MIKFNILLTFALALMALRSATAHREVLEKYHRQPLVSVIIPTTHVRRDLAVAAAFSALTQQTYKEVEVIVVDEGECDRAPYEVLMSTIRSKTREALMRDADALAADLQPRLEAIETETGSHALLGANLDGLVYACVGKMTIGEKRNAAVTLASGDVIAFWDDDDVYERQRLRYQLARLLAGHYDVAALPFEFILDASGSAREAALWHVDDEMKATHFGTLMFVKALHEHVKFSAASIGEDFGFVMRAQRDRGARFYTLPRNEVAWAYARHNASTWSEFKVDRVGEHLLLVPRTEWPAFVDEMERSVGGALASLARAGVNGAERRIDPIVAAVSDENGVRVEQRQAGFAYATTVLSATTTTDVGTTMTSTTDALPSTSTEVYPNCLAASFSDLASRQLIGGAVVGSLRFLRAGNGSGEFNPLGKFLLAPTDAVDDNEAGWTNFVGLEIAFSAPVYVHGWSVGDLDGSFLGVGEQAAVVAVNDGQLVSTSYTFSADTNLRVTSLPMNVNIAPYFDTSSIISTVQRFVGSDGENGTDERNAFTAVFDGKVTSFVTIFSLLRLRPRAVSRGLRLFDENLCIQVADDTTTSPSTSTLPGPTTTTQSPITVSTTDNRPGSSILPTVTDMLTSTSTTDAVTTETLPLEEPCAHFQLYSVNGNGGSLLLSNGVRVWLDTFSGGTGDTGEFQPCPLNQCGARTGEATTFHVRSSARTIDYNRDALVDFAGFRVRFSTPVAISNLGVGDHDGFDQSAVISFAGYQRVPISHVFSDGTFLSDEYELALSDESRAEIPLPSGADPITSLVNVRRFTSSHPSGANALVPEIAYNVTFDGTVDSLFVIMSIYDDPSGGLISILDNKLEVCTLPVTPDGCPSLTSIDTPRGADGSIGWIGFAEVDDGTLGECYTHNGVHAHVNDGDMNSRVDTWRSGQGAYRRFDFVALMYTTPVDVYELEVEFATFWGGGWFGDTAGPEPEGFLTAADLTVPQVQVTRDYGYTWTTVADTNNYVAQLTGHQIAPRVFASTRPPTVTFSFTASGVHGVRLIGHGGGDNDSASEMGFLAVYELSAVREQNCGATINEIGEPLVGANYDVCTSGDGSVFGVIFGQEVIGVPDPRDVVRFYRRSMDGSTYAQLGQTVRGRDNIAVRSCSIDGIGSVVVLGSRRFTDVYMYDVGVDAWVLRDTVEHGGEYGTTALDSSGNRLVVPHESGLRVYEYDGGRYWLYAETRDVGWNAVAVAISSDGQVTAVGKQSGELSEVIVFRVQLGVGLRRIGRFEAGLTGAENTVSLSADGSVLAYGFLDFDFNDFFVPSVRVATFDSFSGYWNTSQEIIVDASESAYPARVALSADGRRALVAAVDVNDGRGVVRLVEYGVGGRWNQVGCTIAGSIRNAFFGGQLALSGDGTKFVVGPSSTISGGMSVARVFRVLD